MNSDEMVQAQRRLRGGLLDGRQSAVMHGSSDLAAHLLLYLDDNERCWELTLEWVRRALDADRVDGGFASACGSVYRPQAEAVRADLPMPTSVGAVFDARAVPVRSVWESPGAVVFESVAGDARFTAPLRAQLLSLNTRAKLAVSLRDGERPIGLICCDWTRERRHWSAELCQQISAVASSVLSPIFSVFHRAAGEREEALFTLPVSPSGAHGPLASLTPAELKVAQLVVTGMSYKEIARQLNRSFSTVDHHLRSIRDKLGARSTARMIGTLSELLNNKQH